MGRLDGRAALVTGAARGMGRAFCVRLAEEGADIVALDISSPVETVDYDLAGADDLAETARLVEAAGGDVLTQRADVRVLDELDAAVAAALERFGHVDIVCANAGIVTHGLSWEMTEDTWTQMIDINLNGVWRTLRAVVPSMIEGDRGGSIIITSSAAGLKGFPAISHYSAAKHGVVGLARSLAVELGEHNIRVNTINPTVVGTPMVFNQASYDAFVPDKPNPGKSDVIEVYRALNVLPVDVIDPADVAGAVAWLASDEARYVTGVSLPIDAGNLQKWTSNTTRPPRSCAPRCSTSWTSYVYPAEPVFDEQVHNADNPWGTPPMHRGAQGRGARARASGTCSSPNSEHGAGLTNLQYAPLRRDHGPQPVDRARGVQLLGAGHRQHGAAGAVRHRRAEAALARPAARGRDPLGVLDDRARGRLVRRDQHRDSDRARRRRLRHQRAQVVVVGRDVAALRAADRDGRQRSRRRAPPPAEHDPRAEGHARASTCAGRRTCSATTTARTAGTPRSSTTTCACPRRTCSAARATGSRSPRRGSGPGRIHHCDARDRDGRARARHDVRAASQPRRVRQAAGRAGRRPALDRRCPDPRSSRCGCWC